VKRSDNKERGINKVTFLEYCQLPGIIGERFFAVNDKNRDDYLDQKEFLYGMIDYFCFNIDKMLAIVFKMFDFDKDKLISKDDVTTLLSSLPLANKVFA
jgi:hypothetical protein